MHDYFSANLAAIQHVNPDLYRKLADIQENSRYEVFQGDEPAAVNILDTQTEAVLYQHPVTELAAQSAEFEKFREYVFLYFFGIGNGFLFKKLLENEKHQRIFVIEPEPELIYIAMHFNDFSADIQNARIVFLDAATVDLHMATQIFLTENSLVYAKVFSLNVPLDYYLNHHQESFTAVHKTMLRALEQMVVVLGNDVTDSLIGLRHHVRNLPRMLKTPTFASFKESRQCDYAVVVSTGPSLYKQLPILKEIKDYITIISVDASLPILINEGIIPDICTSMERVPESAKFFNETPEEGHKDVILLSASLQHDDIYTSFKGDKVVIAMRPFGYNRYFQFDEYGYVCFGMSAANMAHELAYIMGYENVLLIGQDLAYGKDGTSHSKGHVFGADQITDGKDKIDNADYGMLEVEAYGGEGMVKSMYIWKAFNQYFEYTILQSKGLGLTTYNCTEGGARIPGSVEKPFREMADEILSRHEVKKPITLQWPDKETVTQNYDSAKKRLEVLVRDGRKLQSEVEKAFTVIAERTEKIKDLERKAFIGALDFNETVFLIEKISEIRKVLETSPLYGEFFHEILKSYVIHNEMDLGEIKVRYVDNPEDNQEKATLWILGHRYFLFSIAGGISNILDIVEEENPFK